MKKKRIHAIFIIKAYYLCAIFSYLIVGSLILKNVRLDVNENLDTTMGRETCWDNARTTGNRANVGDLIEYLDPLFRHWAVYVGDVDEEPMVCHVWNWNETGFRIRYDSLVFVAEGRECRINNKYDSNGYFSAEEILERAHQKYKEYQGQKYHKYDAVTWNCEHFASWLRNKKGYCDQNSGKMLLNPMNWIDGMRAMGSKMGGSSSSSSSSRSSKEAENADRFVTQQNKKYG